MTDKQALAAAREINEARYEEYCGACPKVQGDG